MNLRALAAATTAAFVVLAPAAASAQGDGHADPRDDAPAYLDITHAHQANNKHVLITTVKIPDRRRNLVEVNAFYDVGAKGGKAYQLTMYIENKRPKDYHKLYKYRGPNHSSAVVCKGDRVTVRAHSLRLRTPQKCLGDDAGRIRMSAEAYDLKAIHQQETPAYDLTEPIRLRRG